MWFLRKLIFGPLAPEKIAKKIVEKVSKLAFRFFRDSEIREMLNFSKISQTEQDRIFNELVVSGLGVTILSLETVAQLTGAERSGLYQKVEKEVIAYYPNWLSELGVEKKYTDIWRELIKMRCDEYRRHFREYRSHLVDLEKENPWPIIVAIDGLQHLRKGKTSPEDSLFKHFRIWIRFLSNKIEEIVVRSI